MGISIYIQDVNHKIVQCADGPLSSLLSDLISDASRGSLLDGIDPHYLTMFNSYQLEFFLMELAAVTPKNDQQKEMINNLQFASSSAIRQRGYLWFIGD